jgi:hypothetical protein
VKWAQTYYRGKPNLVSSWDEYGSLLRLSTDQNTFQPSEPGKGKDKQVGLYSWEQVADLVALWMEGDIGQFVGDYHTHPRGTYYPEDLPSYHDVFRTSALCDWCEVPTASRTLLNMWLEKKYPDLVKLEAFPFAPRLQLIQPVRLGDLFVVTPIEGRERFPTQEDQRSALADMEVRYKNLVNRHGGVSIGRDSDERYQATMRQAVAEINDVIRTRATISYVPLPE